MIIYAYNIHSGGGKILLDAFLNDTLLSPDSVLFFDSRYITPSHITNRYKLISIKPNLFSRWKAEVILWRVSRELRQENIICLGNMPPALRQHNKVILFLQNAFLTPNAPLLTESPRSFIRNLYERIWIRLFITHCDELWVQTQWMKEQCKNMHHTIKINPFTPILPKLARPSKTTYDFLTVTGTEKYKRLGQLLDSWEAAQRKDLRLCVVLSHTTNAIVSQIQHLQARGFNITFFVKISRSHLFSIYSQSNHTLIHSSLESFCLPIYEAAHFESSLISIDAPYTAGSETLWAEQFISFEEFTSWLKQQAPNQKE